MTSKQLRRAAKPVPGESLRGLVADTCAINHTPLWGVVQHFGILHRNRIDLSESDNVDILGLAHALRIDGNEVAARRYDVSTPGHRSFNKISVLKSGLEARARRFSPAAIGQGHLHHPATHELRDLPFSTVGWDMLQDTCPCPEGDTVQGWTRVASAAHCDRCGQRLDRVESPTVHKSLRPSLMLLVDLLDPDKSVQDRALERLPDEIRLENRTLIYKTIVGMARCQVPAASYLSPGRLARDLESETVALARACDAMVAWPDGTHLINSTAAPMRKLWSAVRRNYLLMGRGGTGTPDTLDTEIHKARTPKTLKSFVATGSLGQIKSRLITTRAAELTFGVDKGALYQAWDRGLVTQHHLANGGDRVRAFDPEELAGIAHILRVVLARARVRKALGIPIYGVEQLLRARQITPSPSCSEVSNVIAYMDATEAFTTKLSEAAAPKLEDAIPFREAIGHVSGRPKPWSKALAKLLSGEIKFSVDSQSSHRPVISRLTVPATAIDAFVSAESDPSGQDDIEITDSWSQRDALECMNGYENTLGPLKGLPSIGINPKLYKVTDVLARAQQGVTTTDVARRAGIHARRAYNLLEQAKVPLVAPHFWERSSAEIVLLNTN